MTKNNKTNLKSLPRRGGWKGFLLLVAILCLQACNNEPELNWTPDALEIRFPEILQTKTEKPSRQVTATGV